MNLLMRHPGIGVRAWSRDLHYAHGRKARPPEIGAPLLCFAWSISRCPERHEPAHHPAYSSMRVGPQYEGERSLSWSMGTIDSVREIILPREDPNPFHPVLMANGWDWIPGDGPPPWHFQ